MRFLPVALALLLPLSACAVHPGAAGGPGRGAGAIRAVISPPDVGGLTFHVDRSAHVALFEIVPGRGTSLVYPTPGMGRMDGFVYAGTHRIGELRRHNSAQYLPVSSSVIANGPRFFFLMASERPLDLAQFGGYGMGLRSAMGLQFAALNGYTAMETLAHLVLPTAADDGSWTSDLYVYWPQVLYDSPSRRPGLVQVSCNGYSMFVPLAQIGAVREALCGRRPEIPRDSTSQPAPEGVKPQPRKPLPRAEAEALRERVTSSAQLEERRTRRVTPSARTGTQRAGARDGNRSGAAARGAEDARVGSRPRVTNAPDHAPRGAAGASTRPAGSSEPRARPAAAPREPTSRPSTRPGDTPRPASRGSDCSPCQQQ